MKAIEQIRIRIALAGMEQKELGALIGLDNPNRAYEFFTGEGAFQDQHELLNKARAIVAELTPCPHGVFRILAQHGLDAPLAGVMVRWTRIILNYSLRAWVKRHRMSVWWWSKFENARGDALLVMRDKLYPTTIAAIEEDMIAAVVKMWEVPSWRP